MCSLATSMLRCERFELSTRIVLGLRIVCIVSLLLLLWWLDLWLCWDGNVRPWIKSRSSS
uniref:Transmembrane protein n=1 Tax=Helianthus annuus TaxID=4232 RepID=A0A251SWG4_HELAN